MKARRRPIEVRSILMAVLVCAAFTAVGIFHTWLRVERLTLGYELSRLFSEERALRREHERLRLEVATLEAPARIERIARQRLGMRPPKIHEVIVVREPPDAPAKVARREAPVSGGTRGDG